MVEDIKEVEKEEEVNRSVWQQVKMPEMQL